MEKEILEKVVENTNKNNVLIEKILVALDDNSECKNGLKNEIKNKFFEEFINIVDRMLDNKSDLELSLEFKLEDLYEEIDDFLDDNKIEYFKPQKGDKFDRKIHKAIKKIEVNDKQLDNAIESSTGYGYKFDGVILKTSKVIVNKYVNKESN